MKFVKRITALFLAMVMVMALGITASAATITIKGSDTGSTYKAWKLLDATVSGTNYNYTVNATYRTALQNVVKAADTSITGEASTITDDQILSYIEKQSEAAATRTFADAVYAQIKNMTADATGTGSASEKDVKLKDGSNNEDLAKGYYLIAETNAGKSESSLGTEGQTGTYSLVMLDTAKDDNTEITTKENKPDFEKKVLDTNDSNTTEDDNRGWNDSADYDIGDDVPFTLTATVDEKYASYKGAYKLVFHDKLEANKFVLNTDSIKVYNGAYTNAGKSELTVNSDYTVNTSPSDGCSFEVTVTNVKNISSLVDKKISVYFTAKLQGTAVEYGSNGNINQAKLQYSNNPYDEQGGETGETPWDNVIVFTYKFTVDKKSGSASGTDLAGAAFKLEKVDATSGNVVTTQGYPKLVNCTGNDTNGYTIKSTTDTKFSFEGLDAGTYKLTEVIKPDGYKQIEPITFTVTADHKVTWGATDQRTDILTSLKGNSASGDIVISADTDYKSDGTIPSTVINKSGSALPSTGGMGTTILYVAGVALIVVAGVVVIARKRNA